MHDCITTVVGMKVRDTIHFSILLKLGFKSWGTTLDVASFLNLA